MTTTITSPVSPAVKPVTARVVEEIDRRADGSLVHCRLGRLPSAAAHNAAARIGEAAWISQMLYAEYHSCDAAAVDRLLQGVTLGHTIPEWEDGQIARMLERSIRSRGYSERGYVIEWHGRRIVALGNGRDAVRLSVDALPALHRRVEAVDVGAAIDVPLAPYARFRLPGWFVAWGDHGAPSPSSQEPGQALCRLYWNALSPTTAVEIMRSVTALCNKHRLAFSIKVANHAGGFARCDSVILYLEREALLELRDPLRNLQARLAPDLGVQAAGFSCPVARGVGVAHEPAGRGALSFGQHCADALARALLTAPSGEEPAQIQAVVVRSMRDAGVDAWSPYRLVETKGNEFVAW